MDHSDMTDKSRQIGFVRNRDTPYKGCPVSVRLSRQDGKQMKSAALGQGGRPHREDEDMEIPHYLSRVPESVPPGKIVVHSHVRPTRRLGSRGFRAWLAEPSPRYEVCPCEWAPELGAHYRVRGAL